MNRAIAQFIVVAAVTGVASVIIICLAEYSVDPKVMDYTSGDPAFSHVEKSETVPFVVTFVVGLGLLPWMWFFALKRKDLFMVMLAAWVLASLYTNATVSLTKKLTGRLRPGALSDLDSGVVRPEAAVSFPSGHTAQVFVSSLYVLVSSLHNTRFNIVVGSLYRIGYFIIAWSIAMTRITDNKHHEWDVLGGIVVAYICTYMALYLALETIHEAAAIEWFAASERSDNVVDIVTELPTI